MYSHCNELRPVWGKTSLKHEYDGGGISQSRAVIPLSDGMNSFINTLSIDSVDQVRCRLLRGTPQESFSRLGNRIEENKDRFQSSSLAFQ